MQRDPALLLDILVSSRRALEYARGRSREEFFTDVALQDMIIRRLEIVGEAARQLSQEAKDSTPQYPWRRLVGLRNVLIHQYFRVDLERVWTIVTEDLPRLVALIEPLVPPSDRSSSP